MTRSARWTLILVAFVVLPLVPPASAIAGTAESTAAGAGSVPMYRGGPDRTGENPGPGPAATPIVLWESWLGLMIGSSPAVVDGVVYVGSVSPITREGGALHAVDATTGTELWRLSTVPGDGIFTSPAVTDGLVYAGSYFGIVIAADAVTGEERWRFQAAAAIFSSPAVVDGLVYVGDDAGNFYALDAATGEVRWRRAFAAPFERVVRSTPAVLDGTVYLIAAFHRAGETSWLLALDAATGTERWHFSVEGGDSLRGAPTVSGGSVFALTVDGSIYAVDAAGGKERWHFDGGAQTNFSNPAVVAGVAYFGNVAGDLYALDAASGQQRWVRHLTRGTAIISSPSVADGTLYVGDASGILYAVDVASRGTRWRVTVGSYYSSPAIVGGVVYVGSDQGPLVALGDRPTEPPSL